MWNVEIIWNTELISISTRTKWSEVDVEWAIKLLLVKRRWQRIEIEKRKGKEKKIHCGELSFLSQPEKVRCESFFTKATAYFKILSMRQRELFDNTSVQCSGCHFDLLCHIMDVSSKNWLSLTCLYNHDSVKERSFLRFNDSMQYDTYKWNLIHLCRLLYRVRLLRIEYHHLIVYMELNQPGNFASLGQHIWRFFMSFEERTTERLIDWRAQNEQTGTIPLEPLSLGQNCHNCTLTIRCWFLIACKDEDISWFFYIFRVRWDRKT